MAKTAPEVKTYYTSSGGRIQYIAISYKKGVKIFSRAGYSVSPNSKYMSRTSGNVTQYVHYNSIMRAWIFD